MGQQNSIKVVNDEEIQPANGLKIVHIVSIVITVAIIGFTIYAYMQGYFTSIEDLQELMKTVGIWAPIVFIILQIVQVVIPIIPGGLSLAAGVLLFGPVWGFIYNYLSICMGSLIVFGISKFYGRMVVYKMFPKKATEKYFNWVDTKNTFKKLFAVAIFLPVAPDDMLCYIAGTTNMTWKEYSLIIFLCKPASILVYSLGLTSLLQLLPFL